LEVYITEATAAQELKRIFRAVDSNDNGCIAIDELGNLMSILGIKITEEELVSAMEILDVNGDGVVTPAEFSRSAQMSTFTRS